MDRRGGRLGRAAQRADEGNVELQPVHPALHVEDVQPAHLPVGEDLGHAGDVADGQHVARRGLADVPLEALGIRRGGDEGGDVALVHIFVPRIFDDGGGPDHRLIAARERQIMPVRAEHIVRRGVVEVDGHIVGELKALVRGEGHGHLDLAAAEARHDTRAGAGVIPAVVGHVDAAGAGGRGDVVDGHQRNRRIACGREDLGDQRLSSGAPRRQRAQECQEQAETQQRPLYPLSLSDHPGSSSPHRNGRNKNLYIIIYRCARAVKHICTKASNVFSRYWHILCLTAPGTDDKILHYFKTRT